jgi:hypothetical protein
VAVLDDVGQSWGDWVNAGTPVNNTSGGWSLKHVDLTAYSGKMVHIGFFSCAS